MSAFGYRAKREIRRRRLRRFLRGLALGATIGTVLLAIFWNFFRADLGNLAARIVRQQAAKGIKGSLSFDKLYIDGLGRAIFVNLAITDEHGATVISAPSAVASIDLFSVVGPNRGQRSVALTLNNPEVTLTRREDGSINLGDLTKAPKANASAWGYNVRIRGGTVHFTDYALLRQGYPQWTKLHGMLKDLFDELGYDPSRYGGADVPSATPFSETLIFNGGFSYNPNRQEMALDVNVTRPDKSLATARGTITGGGRSFVLNIGLRDTQLASLKEYIHSLYPKLQLSSNTAVPPNAEPLLAALVRDGTIQLTKPEGKPVQMLLDVQMDNARFNTELFPMLDFPHLRVGYDAPKAALSTDYEVHTAGLAASGNTDIDFSDDRISGKVAVNVTDFAALYKRLGVHGPQLSGQLAADLVLGGRLVKPDISGTVRGSKLTAGGAALGNLTARGSAIAGKINIENLRLSGGALPLSGQGSYTTADGNGSAKFSAGPLQVGAAVALAKALRLKLPASLNRAGGTLSANANLKFANKRVSGDAALSSKHLAVGGQSLDNLAAKVKIERSLLSVQELRAEVQTTSRFKQLGFESEGPLRVALGASGTAQLPPAKNPSLNLTGTLGTLNLSPEQAMVSFDLTGALRAPNFKAQLKTTGETPLVVDASGKLGKQMPLTAAITWGQQHASFDGKLNLSKQSVDGKLTASDVDLARVTPGGNVHGSVSLTAQISGPFRNISASGNIRAPRISGTAGGRDLAVTDLALGFKLAAGNALSISNGAFGFAGSHFSIDGTLGTGGELHLGSEAFDLAQALAASAGKTKLKVEANGPLRAVLTGTLKAPRIALSYSSGPGSIEDRAFDNLELLLTADTSAVHLERLALTGLGGTATASGTATLSGKELRKLRIANYELDADAESLQAALIGPLLGVPMLADVTGTLSGDATLTGDRDKWDLEGGVTLEDGSFHGVHFDDAHVGVATQGQAITLTEAYLVSGDSRIVATGTIGPGKHQLDIHVGAEALDLALLRSFLPRQYQELEGKATFNVVIRPPDAGGYPQIEAQLKDVGGVNFNGVRFSEVELAASLREGMLLIEQARLVSHGSTLRASGRMSPALLVGDVMAGRNHRAAKQQPLNLHVQTEKFNLGVIGALLPASARAALPGGTLTADLTVTGRLSSPQLRGTVDFDLTKLPAGLPVQLASLSGRVVFAENNHFSIENVQIGGGQSGLQQVEIAGGGRFSLNPPSLTAGQVSVNLSPGGRFIHVEDVFGYSGGLGGIINITPPARGGSGFVVGGQLIVNEAKGTGTLAFRIPQSSGGGGPSNFRFDNFQVLVQPGTTVSFAVPLLEVTAQVQGTLTVNGRPGEAPRFGGAVNDQALSIAGKLDIPKGSVLLYRYEARLTSDESSISFNGQPGDYFPRLDAEATLVLRGVLHGNETIDYQANQQVVKPGENDLTVHMAFNNMRLGPGMKMEDMHITSEPPLPQEQLRAYLYGDVYDVLAGKSELGSFAQRELLAYSTSFISRQIERSLDLEAFAFGGGGTDDNPFYIDVEKELSPDVYISYFRTFYSQTQQKEEIDLRYRFFHSHFIGLNQSASVQVGFVRSELQQEAVEVQLQYNVRFGGKKRDPAEVAAAKDAADSGRALTPEQDRLLREPDAPSATPTDVAKPVAAPQDLKGKATSGSKDDGETANVSTDVVIAPPPAPEKQK